MTATATTPAVSQKHPLLGLAPGLALTAGIAISAYALRLIPGVATLSPMIISVLIGALIHNTMGHIAGTGEGVNFSLRRILRLSIVLIGLQITAQQAMEVGVGGVSVIAFALVSTLAATILVGRMLGVSRGVALLIGVGTSICGASAIVAAKAATGGEDDDAAYAVAGITLFGTIAMFLYPALAGVLHLSQAQFGLWAGASVHEVAQAVFASGQGGPEALQIGTIAKLTRVAMMAPVIILLGEIYFRLGLVGGGERGKPPFPWFLVGFLAMAALNSVIAIPAEVSGPIRATTVFLLSMAMAAMGLHTNLRHVFKAGLRPLALGLFASAFISVTALILIKFAL
ncbi:putative sulfate exporter family transporter [Rhodoblastus acidophilus]|uniref:Putative sulfate exporter family transporter n=1 Tax=Rhodoblastus acidophilus TaxID=1074 RepID=A0A6N8DIX9_RHOAC|nr:putative sulfate exporter family transporter [Rhodoblastus acidophilus]MCW2272848.1 putative integral membrane protein (TIGR00698 family) [Rhodoblastus acidophilus]MTV29756.1 putative sulfate exporter family transporter [Rhodoblastus acidophilus]